MKKITLTIIGFLTLSHVIIGQHISMKISDLKMDNQANQGQVEDILKSMKMDTYAQGGLITTEINYMGGMMNVKTLMNEKDPSFTIYMDMMGKKIKVSPTENDLADILKEAEKKKLNSKITKIEGQTKTVAGFLCQKYLVEDVDTNIEMYVSPAIKISPKSIQQLKGFDINGYPLEFTVNTQGMHITFTTETYEEKVEAKKLEVPSGTYESMNFKQLKEQMGGLGGF